MKWHVGTRSFSPTWTRWSELQCRSGQMVELANATYKPHNINYRLTWNIWSRSSVPPTRCFVIPWQKRTFTIAKYMFIVIGKIHWEFSLLNYARLLNNSTSFSNTYRGRYVHLSFVLFPNFLWLLSSPSWGTKEQLFPKKNWMIILGCCTDISPSWKKT